MATSPLGTKRPHPAVFLQDFVDVECAADDVSRRLGGGGAWLTPLASAAGGDGGTLQMRLGPSMSGELVTREVRVRLGQPATTTGGGAVVPIRWEDARYPALFPVLDGDLEVARLDDGSCRLVLNASYRPPLEGIGMLLNQALLHRVAESTARSFLGRVATELCCGEESGQESG